MLVAQRHEFLLARLQRDQRLVAKEVAVELGISEDSVRRDLRELATAGLCQRVYGGALPASPAVVDYRARGQVEVDGKRRVAVAAAALVKPGSTVIIDGGTTALALTAALPATLAVTVVTHSPTVAAALADQPNVEIYLLGGALFKHSVVTCGAAAVEAAQVVNADLFLLGVAGVHPDAGLTTGDADEAAMKRALARRAAETWVMASSEKIGTASRFSVLPFTAVAGIITDAPAGHDTVRQLQQGSTPVILA